MSENANIARHVPKTLRQCVQKAARHSFKQYGFAEQRILSDWPLIVGEQFAAVSLPQQLSFPAGKKNGGTLTIHVSGSWASEVQHMEPYILEKIAAYFGYRAVARIKIVQAPLPPAARNTPSAPLPLPEAAKGQLQALTAGIADTALQRSLQLLGEAIYRRYSPIENSPEKE